MAKSQTARLLDLFQKQGKLTNRFMADNICLRYSARIHELRCEGHTIIANRVKDGLFEYVYISEEQKLDNLIDDIKNNKEFDLDLGDI